MFGLGPMELAIILVIVVILFGARRLPEIGSGFGKAIKNFKAGLSGNEIDVTPEREQVGDRSDRPGGSSSGNASNAQSASKESSADPRGKS